MAKSKLSFKRSINDKLDVKGLLSEDGTTVTYFDEYDNEQTARVTDLLSVFANKEISITISLKTDEELELPEPTEDE